VGAGAAVTAGRSGSRSKGKGKGGVRGMVEVEDGGDEDEEQLRKL
jgi:hypothetical protein